MVHDAQSNVIQAGLSQAESGVTSCVSLHMHQLQTEPGMMHEWHDV